MQIDREYIQPFLTQKAYSRGDQLIVRYSELNELAQREKEEHT
jgi:hypothetical protein